MSRYSIEGSTLTAIGDAIRNKSGKLTKPDYADSKILELNLPYATIQYFNKFPDNAYTVKIKRLSGTYKDFLVFKNIANNRIFDFDDPNVTEVLLNIKEENLYRIGFVHYDSAPQQGNFEIIFYDINNNIIPLLIEVPNTMTPNQMAEEVQNMLPPPPEEAFKITGDCSYRLAYDGWNWYLEAFKNKLTTQDISNCSYMFNYSQTLTDIPFDINVSNKCVKYKNMFYYAKNLNSVPQIMSNGDIAPPTSAYSGMMDLTGLFSYANSVKVIPYDFFNNFITEEHFNKAMTFTAGGRNDIFNACYSLRKHPDLSRVPSGNTSIYSSFYYNLFNNCYCLDEIIDLPVVNVAYTSNAFNNSFNACNRLKTLTFKDGATKAVAWKNQTINLSSYVGYAQFATIGSWGVSEEDWVSINNQGNAEATAEAYHNLKNTEDWWTTDTNYSRYNHDSAVETINSLPDVSAGSGNTIKFKGAAGALTDGGAINTLTEEEIAVATAKGWTVTLA